MTESLPRGPVLAWYGDDFTGAAAVMEALTFGGVPAVLFLDVPTRAQLDRFAGFGGIGVAGVARSKSPEWMDRALPPVFSFLKSLGAPLTQYKVCSTFDSSPEIGSIGHAYDIGVPILGGRWTPLLVAAPLVHRYQMFGNLFAGVAGTYYRLDRHPTMSRHPVTPMREADLRIHLGRQTRERIGLIDVVAMKAGTAQAALEQSIARGDRIISLDVADDDTLREAGRLVWQNRSERLFAIGSQGLEYALLAHWHAAGLVAEPSQPPRITRADRVAAVSGSCSPVTAEQILWAQAHGFRVIRLDVTKAVEGSRVWEAEQERAVTAALATLSEGADPLVVTACGPDDSAIDALREALTASGADSSLVNLRIGEGLGQILSRVLRRTKLNRGIIAGGDTSSYATAALGIYALTALASTVAGAALFQAHSENPEQATLEIALKGGQMGSPDYFGRIKLGG
ncbi:hypothetical protein FRZ61_43890 [Hypericibacter adhaerens]|jgi:uncharacterized protein YgbK (DUF1537 family)|uniref:Type III effector n=1 Tax=Hypericibacter adhaerens TaxID=2602016 RepID=A0A5J6N374_9PROT|nr:four-carbon acid sugar kinase family protein [Hypericibacter adhaerens]QEX24448.1 hypothetical protein FRZ61_43890 [Hypericibacter adhaerens]